MKTVDQLKQAMIQADSKGDKDAVKFFVGKLQELESSKTSLPAAAAMKFADGATMGFADEIIGGSRALMSYPASLFSDADASQTEGMDFGDRYEMYRDKERDRLGRIAQERPTTSAIAETAGGVVGALIPATKGITAFKAGQTLPRMMGAGAVDGAGYGAANALGRTDELDSQAIADVGAGAVTGAAMGGVTPAVTQPLSGIAGAVAQRFKPAYEQASNRVAGALGQAKMSGDDLTAKMSGLGDDAMMIDAMGTPGQSLGRSAVNASPVAEDILMGQVSARQAGMPDRLSSSLMDASGLSQPLTTKEMQQQIARQSRPAITRAYEKAKDAGQDVGLYQFRDMFKLPMVQKAMSKAKGSQKNYLPGESEGGRLGFLNEVKKQLDSTGSKAERSGDFNAMRQARDLAKELRTRVDKTTPEYGGARGLARDSYLRQEAVELGAKGANPTVANDFSRNVLGLDDAFKPEAAKGYAGAKISQIENRRSTPGAVDAMFGSNRSQEAMRAALGQKASVVDDQLARERQYSATNRALSQNSSTAKQLAQMGGSGALGFGAGLYGTGDPTTSAALAATAMAGRAGGSRALQAFNAHNEAKVAPIVAELLAGRELPQQVLEQIQKNPNIQAAISRALATASTQ